MGEIILKLPLPHAGQIEVLKSPARFKVLKCGRRWGKSLIAQVIGIDGMLNAKSIAYITPQFKLAKKFFKEVMKMLPPAAIESSNKTDLVIELKTGGSISFFSGEALDALRGSKFHTVIIDEAAFIPDLEEGWLNSIRPTLTDYRGNALFISTPRGKNFFYTLFLRGKAGKNGYQSFEYTSYDNPHIRKSEIDAAKLEVPKAVFDQEYLAIAAANAAAVVTVDMIERGTIEVLSKKPTVCYGIDVAKYSDYTSITGVDEDGVMSYHDHFQKDNEITKQKILALPEKVLKVMDSTHGSLGDGIFEDLLNHRGAKNLLGFEFTAASKPKLITELILDIEQDNIKYNKQTADEISIFEYAYSSTGYIKYGAAPGGHDDCVISLALANRYRKQVPKNFLSGFKFGNAA